MIITKGYGYDVMEVNGEAITVNITQDSVITFDIEEEEIDVTAGTIEVSVSIDQNDEVTVEVN